MPEPSPAELAASGVAVLLASAAAARASDCLGCAPVIADLATLNTCHVTLLFLEIFAAALGVWCSYNHVTKALQSLSQTCHVRLTPPY
jgi:hypothetical protein